MKPPIFSTREQIYTNSRKNQAIQREIEIGGKFWCWHDYTYFTPVMRENIFDWGMLHKCVKCGKSKIFKNMQIEPLPPVGSN